MSDAPTRWTRHRPIAHAIARDYFIRGASREDVEQEALIALWEACRCYDRSKGTFPPFARIVIHRRLRDAVKIANRHYHKPTDHADEEQAPDEIEARHKVDAVVAAFAGLTDRERACVIASVNGDRLTRSDHASLYVARKKLRTVAA